MAQSSKSRTLDFNPKQLFNIKSNQFPSKNSTKSTSRFLPKLDSFTPSSSLLFFRSTKFNAPKKLEEIRNQNMGSMAIYPLLPSKPRSSVLEQNSFVFPSRRKSKKMKLSFSPVARLFGPSIFEASKLKVLFVGVDEEKHPGKLPRTYTLTHSDITAKLTLAVSQTINNSQLQGWGNKIYRDEVVAEWKKVKGKMSLHVHCHISGGHFLLDLCARLRYFIFCKELPVVLKAFVHGDGNLFNNYPELEEALVWVYFHSNIPEFNRVECWGPLGDPVRPSTESDKLETPTSNRELPEPCKDNCECCFPPISVIHWSNKSESRQDDTQQGFHQATE